MLPDSSMDLKMAAQNPSLFVDTGINYLIESLVQMGANKEYLVVHLAGGADIPHTDPILTVGVPIAPLLTWLSKSWEYPSIVEHWAGWFRDPSASSWTRAAW